MVVVHLKDPVSTHVEAAPTTDMAPAVRVLVPADTKVIADVLQAVPRSVASRK